MPSDIGASPDQHVGQWLATLAVALAFGTLAGLAAWQFGARRHSGPVSSVAVQAPAQPEAAAPANPPPTASSSVRTPWREEDLYVVNSDAQAEQLRAAIASVSDPMQVPFSEVIVLPNAGLAATDQLRLGLSIANQERWLQGLPPVQLIDLRRAPAGVAD